jgi:hypothetical protein
MIFRSMLADGALDANGFRLTIGEPVSLGFVKRGSGVLRKFAGFDGTFKVIEARWKLISSIDRIFEESSEAVEGELKTRSPFWRSEILGLLFCEVSNRQAL